jgi:hypothetical protein
MNSNTLRIVGSVSGLIGYFLLLYLDVRIGCMISLIGGCLIIPFAISIKTWDVVGLQSFFAVIDLSKIIELSL